MTDVLIGQLETLVIQEERTRRMKDIILQGASGDDEVSDGGQGGDRAGLAAGGRAGQIVELVVAVEGGAAGERPVEGRLPHQIFQ